MQKYSWAQWGLARLMWDPSVLFLHTESFFLRLVLEEEGVHVCSASFGWVESTPAILLWYQFIQLWFMYIWYFDACLRCLFWLTRVNSLAIPVTVALQTFCLLTFFLGFRCRSAACFRWKESTLQSANSNSFGSLFWNFASCLRCVFWLSRVNSS